MTEKIKFIEKNKKIIIFLSLAFILSITLIVFFNSLNNSFLANWDDNAYVLVNNSIKELSSQNINTIFTSFYVGHYQPISILSYAIEYHFFGLNPRAYHTTNLIFHLLNIVLVFFLIFTLSRRIEAAFITALLFAIHPLHVESVAWISERKDVMYAFFYIASLISYVYYLKKNKLKYLIFTAILFVFSLLSKSAAVTLPVLLLLFDFYYKRKLTRVLILEKLPFFALSIFFGILAIISQKSSGAMLELVDRFSIFDRFFIIFYGINFYLLKLFAPLNLSAIHCYPVKINGMLPLEYYIAPLIILIIVFLIFKSKKICHEIVFGTLFFLISISIVLKIIPLGMDVVAERNTYVPYIGLFFIIGMFYTYVVDNKFKFSKKLKPILRIVLAIYIVFLSILCYQRTKVWKDSISLFSDVIEKHPEFPQAYYIRGIEKINRKDFNGAVSDFDKAIKLDSVFIDAYLNRANSRYYIKDFDGSMSDFNKIIELAPNNANAYKNRGILEFQLKMYDNACSDWQKAFELGDKEVLTEIYKHCK